jgi:hypothetical protein
MRNAFQIVEKYSKINEKRENNNWEKVNEKKVSQERLGF